MESRDYIRPFLMLLVGVGLVVLVIVLIIKAFSGGASAPSSQIDITKFDNSTGSTTLLIDAPTGIDQDHRQVKITVSGTENEVDVIKGYEGQVMDSQTYPSNVTAYGAFLQTLKLMNFSKGVESNVNYQGYCPTGDRYIFTFNNGENDLFSYWATSCGGQGTFKGGLAPVLTQFRRQIPETDFDQLTNAISLGF
jgi:hypothetical protein